MSKRKLIYVPSEETWESVKRAAREDGRSASNYLIQLHKVNVGIARPSEYGFDNLHIEIDNIAAKLQLNPCEALDIWHLGVEQRKKK